MGAVVCVVNDACDVWFEAAKLASYAKLETLSALFYCAFAASWLALRMIYSPMVVLPSVWNEAWGLVVRFGPSDFHVGLWATFNALLLVLQLQHVYWWYFIAAKIHLTASITIVNNPKRAQKAASAAAASATGGSKKAPLAGGPSSEAGSSSASEDGGGSSSQDLRGMGRKERGSVGGSDSE